MEKETKKPKGGAEKERERKKKKLIEIAAKFMNIQDAFARASTSTESQTTINPALLLEHQDQHQSVSYRDVRASNLVNQNCSDISIPPVSQYNTAHVKSVLRLLLNMLQHVLGNSLRCGSAFFTTVKLEIVTQDMLQHV